MGAVVVAPTRRESGDSFLFIGWQESKLADHKLQIVAINPDGLVHAAADGNLTGGDARADSANPFGSLLGANWRGGRVMVDLSRCAMIDSAAIGTLVDSNKQFKGGGGMLVLYSLSPRVRDVMKLLKLDQLLNLAANEAAARAMFQAAAGGPGSTEAGQ